ncbi:MAG: rhodanese-like domain-containing protein [Bacillota bacterium]
MKKVLAVGTIVLAAVILAFVTGVGPGSTLVDPGRYIVEAKDVVKLLKNEQVVLVDMQESAAYAAGHIDGAVNIERNEVVINTPYPNLLAPQAQVAQVLGSRGIDRETTVLIYDDSNNMDAARLWWTMMVYGHENVSVVSGGFEALKQAGLPVSVEVPAVTAKIYEAGEIDRSLLAAMEDVEAQVKDPQDDIILLDTRTRDEYTSGTIPGALLVDYSENIFDDGTYKPVQQILINYKNKGITADKEIIVFCAVSVRGSQTLLALYNAGYRNVKLYDAAWVEYSDVGFFPESDDVPVEGGPAPQAPAAPSGGCS